MYPVTAQYGPAVRLPHTKLLSAVHRNLVTGTSTTLDVLDGTVTEDVGANNRWTLGLSVPPVQATFDALDTPGGEITVRQGIKYVNGAVEWVPLGVHIVDEDGLDYSPDGTISVTGYDRSLKVQRNALAPDQRSSVASNKVWQEIQRLVEGAWPGTTYPFPGWSLLDTTATAKVGPLVYDGDRWAAVTQLCVDNSLEMFFDDLGKGVLRPVPVLNTSSVPVWTVDAGEHGVMLDADRTRDMSKTRNVVIVSTSATDITFPPQVVANTTAGDPLNTTGPLGYVPFEYSSASLRSSAQARAAGRTMLATQLGVAKTLTLDAVGHSGLRARDVVLVKLPNITRGTTRPTELHILDTVSHPLVPDGVQAIATRSTRPDSDGS